MPAQPRPMWSSNRVCEAVQRHREQQMHRHNILAVKPMIDNRDPRRPRSMNSNGARIQAERNAQIMQENTILLNKLSRVLTRENQLPRATLNTRRLHDPSRKAEREKIDHDNLLLLRRLQYVKPTVHSESQLQQHREHARLLALNRNFAANPFLFNSGPLLPAGSGIAAARRRPCSASSGERVNGMETSLDSSKNPNYDTSEHQPEPATDSSEALKPASEESSAAMPVI